MAFPGWLVVGLGLGGVLGLVVAAVLVVGSQRFPTQAHHSNEGAAGERKRRTEIREYLRRIDEPFREDVTIGDRPVAFDLVDRGVAITFDPKTYFALQNEGLTVILVEHELPGWQIGPRLPFEAPSVPTRDSEAITAFEVLGLPADASVSDVRTAYREQVKDAHPDHGGDRESFERIREAYTIAVKQAG